MGASFRDIFEPINDNEVIIQDANCSDHLLYAEPRRHNMWMSLPALRLQYGKRVVPCNKATYSRRLIRDVDMYDLKKDTAFDFIKWQCERDVYISSCTDWGNPDNHIYQHLFRPVTVVRDEVKKYTALFSTYTIGFHIRRTDNSRSIKESPTKLFIEAGQREKAVHPNLRIFLATDDAMTKEEMQHAFGHRIITMPHERSLSRATIDGIRGGLIDMYTLAATSHIYGSAGSTFSMAANCIGGVIN